ncbi:MAG: polysaccharide biosynthesis C-terminal domain-containing protein [Bacillota bacterium]
MNSDRQIKLGAILAYMQIALSAIIALTYTPFMLSILGQSEYGLYNTVSSTISSLSILSLGFGSCYIRFFSRYKAENDVEGIKSFNGMFMLIFLVIGVVALGCGLFISNNLSIVFDQGLTSSEFETAKKLMVLLSVSLAITFPCSVFTSIITANERFVFQKIIVLIRQVVSPLICIPLLLMGYASIGLVVSSVCIGIIMDFINAYFCFVKLQTKFNFRKFNWNILKEMWIYSSFIAINLIVDQINWNIDKLLLARFVGTASVAVYSVGYILFMQYLSFSTAVSSVFTPKIHGIWNNISYTTEEKNDILTNLFVKVGRIQFIILLLICSGLIFFGKQFILLWAGTGYENAYYIVVLLSVFGIISSSQNLGIEIQRAQNKHKFRSIVYFVMAILNLILSIYLCQIWGEVGSAIGTALSFLIANIIIMNIYYKKAIKLDVGKYWKVILKVVVSALPAFICGVLICKYLDTTSLLLMLVGICIYSVVYLLSILILNLNKDERSLIVQGIIGAINKVRKNKN